MKNQSQFVFHKTKQRYENRCLPCKSLYTIEKNRSIRLRNRDYIQSVKSNTPCSACGNKYHFCQLDFNHIDPSTKRYELWRVTTQSLVSIKAEIAKCELICANCHREKTQQSFGQIKLDASLVNQRYSAFINDLKSDKVCPDCDGKYPYYVMDFDHLAAKNFEMNRARQQRVDKDKVRAEVAMCALVCVNCHRLRTYRKSINTSTSEASSLSVDPSPGLFEPPTFPAV